MVAGGPAREILGVGVDHWTAHNTCRSVCSLIILQGATRLNIDLCLHHRSHDMVTNHWVHRPGPLKLGAVALAKSVILPTKVEDANEVESYAWCTTNDTF